MIFPVIEKKVPSETTTMYGRKVIRKKITAETVPILADEKNVEIMKLKLEINRNSMK